MPVVEDPPLARSLFDAVALEAEIPEDFYRAVAELLAYVYRTAGAGAVADRRAPHERGMSAQEAAGRTPTWSPRSRSCWSW